MITGFQKNPKLELWKDPDDLRLPVWKTDRPSLRFTPYCQDPWSLWTHRPRAVGCRGQPPLPLACTPEPEAAVVEQDTGSQANWDQGLHAGFSCPLLWVWVFLAFRWPQSMRGVKHLISTTALLWCCGWEGKHEAGSDFRALHSQEWNLTALHFLSQTYDLDLPWLLFQGRCFQPSVMVRPLILPTGGVRPDIVNLSSMIITATGHPTIPGLQVRPQLVVSSA